MIGQKLEILDEIGRKSYKVLSEKYGVGISMISDFKKEVLTSEAINKVDGDGLPETNKNYEVRERPRTGRSIVGLVSLEDRSPFDN